ncbi:HD domain-containing protein [Bdellovibrio bacteriovorus]|uniref:HD-hydrolase domain containing protein n=1 Tax=Bdellovibrio bacteriovorus (strain ATCC 15356 / DSM 50701 / NCIMB 9529 / HD100) TaxID=264462 RepID=Q6MIN6_BDEBA|nr:HD domain-containing protein [Bdellovibrio bacteriovorus]AHZ83506.1 HD family phosphohydrolase [Bdellovibrio bacteriovorus]BEV69476.1 3'-5' exoribonuclease YhaM [Bdellovibrio bacteriovorus]CAE80877.1 HD-hydrolase domain containing protein [Bdellovibrio bacteriovorus HD100]
MEKQTVQSLQDKSNVDSLFLVKEKTVSVGKNGRPFMGLQLGDATGTIDARLWDRVDELAREFEIGDILRVKGLVQIFQHRKQLIVHRLERVEASTVDMADFIPATARNAEDMMAELTQLVRSMKNDYLRQLVTDTLEDPEIRPMVLRAPAAKSIHHAWMGGLLEHILSICKIMDFMGTHYPFLNRDLLLFGAIFHDIGKVWELSYDNGISYTDRGRLIGHMQIACELIDKKSSRILGFSEELRDICKHIILSHHGKLEYGSPKRPKFLEAMVVAMVDDFDSKVATVKTLMDNERGSGEKWSRYSELFDRYFLLDDMNEKY